MSTIANYWTLDLPQQKEIIKETGTQPIKSAGARDFSIVGEIKAIREYYCDCEFCEGHREVNYLQIDKDVYADNEDQAIEMAVAAVDELDEYDRWEWKKGDPQVFQNRVKNE